MKIKIHEFALICVVCFVSSCGSKSQPKIIVDDVKTVELGDLTDSKYLMYKRNNAIVYSSMERDVVLAADPNSRFFFVEKKCVFAEEDIDGDGFYEQSVAFLPSGESVGWNGVDPFEIFIRSKDGSVVIGNTEVRKQFYKRYKRALEELKAEVNKLTN